MYINKLFFILVFATFTSFAQGQELLRLPPNFEIESATLFDAINHLESTNRIQISYNSNKFDNNAVIYFAEKFSTLEDLLKFIFNGRATFEEKKNRKILVYPKNEAQVISGVIVDKNSGETLPGARVKIEGLQETQIIANANGFFTLKTDPVDNLVLKVNYFGYDESEINVTPRQKKLRIELEQGYKIPDIVITGRAHLGEYEIPLTFMDEASLFPSLLGEKDIINSLKKNPQIVTGGEAQNGIIVRGGNTDQNLILMDGVPIYEISHLGGLSSIIVNDAVKSSDFYASGFPARFGGRLSSVVDLHLKEGNNKKQSGNFQASLLGLKTNFEGPIVEGKTSFNLSGRFSYFDLYLNPVVKNQTLLDDSDLSYYDLHAKITHSFSPSNRISISGYRGLDEVSIVQNENEADELAFSNNNRIEWGNQMLNFQWDFAAGSKFFFKNQFYLNDYDLLSRGSYIYEILNDNDDIENREFDAFTFSNIRDVSWSSSMDYHVSNELKFNAGVKLARHRYRPNIVQSRFIITESEILDTLFDETYNTFESAYFAEGQATVNKWMINLGLHVSSFSNERTYWNLQPRLSISYPIHPKSNVRLAASRMAQYVHLLVNPGIGLPSELWVPSTPDVGPETANEVSLQMDWHLSKSFNLQVGAYYKSYEGLLDFRESTDIFFYILNDSDFVPPFVTGENWESRVVVGSGRSRGLELLMNYDSGKFKSWLSYAYGKSDRQFPDINNGQYFPFRYDYRHDVNIGMLYKLSDKVVASMFWVFNSGKRYTLATDRARAADGRWVYVKPERNNKLFPDYHHLDFNVEYTTTLYENPLVLTFGVYNAYNRFNPYYLYLLEDSDESFSFNQLSLFPLLPQLGAEYSF